VDKLLRRPIFRVIPVGLVLIAFQRTAFETAHPFGVVVQVALAFCAAGGIPGGAERGAWLGFVVGVMYDLGTAAPLGQHALAYGLAGFVAGLVNAVAVDPHWWLKLIFVALGGATGEFTVPVVNTFVNDNGWQAPHLAKILLVIAVSSAVFSYAFIPLSRWTLAIRKKTWKPR
jgi:rod shape-determining protein MreD